MRKPLSRKTVLGVGLYMVAALGLALLAGAVSLVLVLGPKLVGFNGITKEQISKATINISPDLIEQAKNTVGDDVLNAMDCSNYPPSKRAPGVNCIEGLLARDSDTASPVPERAAFMVPIWQAAGKRYQLPWELLAAVEGARSNFGWVNCESDNGNGPYRIYPKPGERYATDGGSMFMKKHGNGCYEAVPPDAAPPVKRTKRQKKAAKVRYEIKLKKQKPLAELRQDRRSPANLYDPVDATFTTAAMLAHRGAFKRKTWDYSGSGPAQCTVSPSDGRVWYVPFMDLGYGPGAKIGFNKRLDIPKRAALIAAKYRSNKGKYKPRRDDDPLDEKLGYHPMPKAHLVYLLRAAWFAFGARGEQLNYNVTANYAQVGHESGGRPYLLQGHIGDVNDNNPAGGLFQFIISTFDHWKVDGFNDRFNPLDNILAAVNAQVNGPYKILSGGIGWSPPFSHNPYSTGGRSRLVGDRETAGRLPKKPYRGKAQTDSISKAVRYQTDGYPASDCYVAVVNEWYRQIKKHPPSESISGPIRERIVKISQAELKKNVTETGGDNVPRYRPSNEIAVYNINNQWCQAFASRVWYWAGLKKATREMSAIGGMVQQDGKVMPAYTGVPPVWAQERGHYKTDDPLPGDMAFYGTSHVEIVEKVKNGKVLSTIGGNTSNAVTRVISPSGITHFVSPPASATPSSYDLERTDERTPDLNRFAKRLGVRAGAIVTGQKTKGNGKINSTFAFEAIGVPIAIAAVDQANGFDKMTDSKQQMVIQALNGSRVAINYLVKTLGRKSTRKIESVFRKSGDPLTTVSRNRYRTIWTGEASNRLMMKLADGKLLDKKSTNMIVNHLRKGKVASGGIDPHKTPKRIYRVTKAGPNRAVTVFVQPLRNVKLKEAAERILWRIQ